MADRVFKKVNLTGCSDESYEQAIRAAVAKAGETLHNLSWFEVREMRGAILDGAVSEFQVAVDVAFKID